MKTKNTMLSFFTALGGLCIEAPPLYADGTFGNYAYTDDGFAVTITNYDPTATGPVTIPSTIAGMPVTGGCGHA